MFSSDSLNDLFRPVEEAVAEVERVKKMMPKPGEGAFVFSIDLAASIDNLTQLFKEGHKNLSQLGRDYKQMASHFGVDLTTLYLHDPTFKTKLRNEHKLFRGICAVLESSRVRGDALILDGGPIGYFVPESSDLTLDIAVFVYSVCRPLRMKRDDSSKRRIHWLLQILGVLRAKHEMKTIKVRGRPYESWIIRTENRNINVVRVELVRRYEELLHNHEVGAASETSQPAERTNETDASAIITDSHT